MGLFNKLKNVLFEEEEIEIPATEPPKKEIKKEEKKRNVYDESIKEDIPVTNDNSLFKAEKTFDFPLFDDEEFDEMKTLKEPVEEPKKNMSINLFDYDKPRIKKEPVNKTNEIKGRAYENKSSNFNTRKFKPSPVISPVYGVLDKNYKKEDIIVKQEEKKQIDVDDVRKKAFGTLEDDIEKNLLASTKEEKTLKTKTNTFKEEKTIDELLEETAFDTIEIPDYNESDSTEKKREEQEENKPIELEVLDKKEDKTEEEKIEEDDTLENDLFDLIDSMYENREDE